MNLRHGLAGLLMLLAIVTPLQADVDAEKVRVAIERGVAFLKAQQNGNGSWAESYQGLAPHGVSALCTLALINCGVPLDDPALVRALDYLRTLKPDHTYDTALQTMVFCAADPQRDMLKINENVKFLESAQKDADRGQFKGTWGYTRGMGSGDNSNAQFAMLALYEAARVGVPISEPVLRKARDWWESGQGDDGSWGYVPNHRGTGSMTCAGIGSLVMIYERLNPGDAKIVNANVQCCGKHADETAIDKALTWLGRNFSVHRNPGMGGGDTYLFYYLYGVERVGRLTNRRFIGGHDWYREGAELLVSLQNNPPGSWRGTGGAEGNQLVATPLALLFLAKGRRAVVVARLRHKPDNDWSPHRRDLANLVNYTEQRWKRDLTWQVIDVAAADAGDLMQSPVLTISGKAPPRFSDDEVALLRKYIDLGGFILAENCCSDNRFDDGIRQLAGRIFPEPEYQLRLLEAGHPIWTAEERVDAKYMPPLYGIDYGCRTCFVYCAKNIGCYWELAVPGKPIVEKRVREETSAALSVGINMLAYATNRELKYKLDAALDIAANDTGDKGARGRLSIAKLQHNGGWNVAPAALSNLLRTVEKQTGLPVSTERREVALTGEQLKNYHLLFMHGRNAFTFSAAERKALREYLDRGGMLVADAVCANEAFTQSLRAELAAIFPDQKLQPVPASHELFTNQFGGFDLPSVSVRLPDARQAGDPLKAVHRTQPPELEGVQLGDRYAVLFSPYDLSCALEGHNSLECKGYTRDDAAKLGLNIILYSLH